MKLILVTIMLVLSVACTNIYIYDSVDVVIDASKHVNTEAGLLR